MKKQFLTMALLLVGASAVRAYEYAGLALPSSTSWAATHAGVPSVADAAPDTDEPLSLSQTSLNLYKNEGCTLHLTGTPVGEVMWESSAPTIASVDNEGHVSGIAGGSATITVKEDGAVKGTCNVTVNSGNFPGYSSSIGTSQYYIDGIWYSISGGTAVVTFKGQKYNQYSNEYQGDVVIPSTVVFGSSKYDVTKIVDDAFNSCTNLSSVTFGTGLTSIGNYAFYGCTNLSSVTFNEGLTSIGNYAFQNCSSIANDIVLPNTLTSIGSSAFDGCTNIPSVTFNEGLPSIGSSAFKNCSSIANAIVLPNTLTSIGSNAFSGCTNIPSVTFGTSLTSIGSSAFSGCSSIANDIVLPNTLTTIDSYAFDGCTNIASVTFNEGLTKIGNFVFRSCSLITSITIPNSVKSIGSSVFSGCSALESIELPFVGTSATATSASFNTLFGVIFGTESYTGGVNIRQSYDSGMGYGFCIPSTLKSVTINGGKLFGGAFKNCSNLTSITLNNVTGDVGDYAFQNCSSMANAIVLPNSATSIGQYAFDGCTNLSSVTFGTGLTSIGDYAFKGCTNLPSVTFGTGLTSIGIAAFQNCKNIPSAKIPNSVTTIGSLAFSGCSSLEYIHLPFAGNLASATTPSSSTLFGYIFGTASYTGGVSTKQYYSASDYSTYYIPEKLKSITITGGDILPYAYNGLTGIEKIVIEDGVTKVGDNAFKGCSDLVNVSLGENVTEIGQNAFDGLTMLERFDVLSAATTPITLANPASVSSNGLIYVQPSLIASYKEADNWKNHASQIVEINTVTDYDVVVEAKSDKSTLHVAIGDENLIKVMSLKVKGTINSYDLMLINNKLVNLKELDLSEATIVATPYEYYTGYCSKDNTLDRYSIPSRLTSLQLPNNLVTLGDYALQGKNRLTRLTIPSTVETIGQYALDGCANIANAIVIPEATRSIGHYAFQNCSSLPSCKILGPVPTIPSYAFYGCTSLETVSLPESVTGISMYAFRNSSLKEIQLPNGLKTIGTYAFANTKLTEIVVPNSVTSIGTSALYGTSLESLSVPFTGASGGHVGQIFSGSNSWANIPYTLKKITITGPEIKVNAFNYSNSDGGAGQMANIDLYVTNNLQTVSAIPTNSSSTIKLFKGLHVEDVNEWAKVKFVNTGSFFQGLSGNLYEGENLLEDLNLKEGLDAINPYVFDGFQSIKHVNVSSTVKTIGKYAFSGCTGLETCVLPTNSQAEAIPDYAFSGCTSLQRMDLPTSVTSIGKYAFQNCAAMTEVKLPSSITSIGDYAFTGCSALNDVYTYTIEPQQINQNTFSTYETAFLHCPKVSYYDYFYDTQWSQFLNIKNFDEPYTYVHIVNDFELQTTENGTISGTPRVDIDAGGGLTVKGDQEQRFSDVHISYTAATQLGASLIGNNNLMAQKLFIDITVGANKWYFFSFPYDIDCTKIEKAGSYIFRKYDGDVRATNGSGGWVDLAPGETTLKAGTGYIFQTNTAGLLSLPVTAPELAAINLRTALNEHNSDIPANSNWNFCGNRYISYFSINDLEYESPIVVWDGSKYVAYRPGDDEYVFTPFQAFFVQKANGVDGVGFDANGRTTYQGSQNSAARARARQAKALKLNPDRLLINLLLSDGEDEDKCRIVFNDKQMMGYELGCDASKFLEGTASLIYSMDADRNKYAINERPVDKGIVPLGMKFTKDGSYTISADRMDTKMLLVDRQTGVTHDFEEGDYTFYAEAGAEEGRFYLRLPEDATGMTAASLKDASKKGTAYDLYGRRADNARKGIIIENGKKFVK